MSATYYKAEEVEKIAHSLIDDHYPDIAKNPDVDIIYRFEDPTREKNGKQILGQCRLISGLTSFLYREGNELEPSTKPLFLILISAPAWTVLNPNQRVALVDHELAHVNVEIGEKGDTKLSIRPHDVEEFQSIIERHGLSED